MTEPFGGGDVSRKARKQAEHELKVEQEKARLQAKAQAREEARARAAAQWAALSPEEQKRKMILGGVVVGLAVLGVVLFAVLGGNDDRDSNTPTNHDRNVQLGSDLSGDGELKTCPDSLEALAERTDGFVEGVDALYDPAMDWDGDGVSCE